MTVRHNYLSLDVTIRAIVARDLNHGIGKDGDIPWHCSEDLQHFKKETKGCTVIMGRKTAESIVKRLGGPLPDRTNIVLSKSGWTSNNFITVKSKKEVFELYNSADNYYHNHPDVYVIGGKEIYDLFMPETEEIILSDIGVEHECDTFFEVPDEFTPCAMSQVLGGHGTPRVVTVLNRRGRARRRGGLWSP